MSPPQRRSALIRTGVALSVVALATSCTRGPGTSEVADPAAVADAETDDGDLPRVTVQRRDFGFSLKLDGATVAGDGVRLAPGSELLFVADVDDGDAVAAGDAVGRLEVPEELANALGGEAAGPIDRARLEMLEAAERQVAAPIAGTLQAGEIVAPGIDVTVRLTPVQAMRVASASVSGTAAVDTLTGRRSVDCAAVWIITTMAAELLDQEVSTDPSQSELRCRLPSHIATVPGLRVSLEVRSEVLEDVAVVPTAFIGYDADLDRYTVWLDRDGNIEVVPVDVGMTDGVLQVVTSPIETGVPLRRPEPGT